MFGLDIHDGFGSLTLELLSSCILIGHWKVGFQVFNCSIKLSFLDYSLSSGYDLYVGGCQITQQCSVLHLSWLFLFSRIRWKAFFYSFNYSLLWRDHPIVFNWHSVPEYVKRILFCIFFQPRLLVEDLYHFVCFNSLPLLRPYSGQLDGFKWRLLVELRRVFLFWFLSWSMARFLTWFVNWLLYRIGGYQVGAKYLLNLIV